MRSAIVTPIRLSPAMIPDETGTVYSSWIFGFARESQSTTKAPMNIETVLKPLSVKARPRPVADVRGHQVRRDVTRLYRAARELRDLAEGADRGDVGPAGRPSRHDLQEKGRQNGDHPHPPGDVEERGAESDGRETEHEEAPEEPGARHFDPVHLIHAPA